MHRLPIDVRHPAILALILTAPALLVGCAGIHGGRKPPPDTPATGFELYYVLPRTVLTVTAPITRNETKKGTCADYLGAKVCADGSETCSPGDQQTLAKALGLPPAITEFSTYSLGKLAMASQSEADVTEIHQLPLTGSRLAERALIVELSEAGLLITGDSTVKPRGLQLAAGVIKSIAGIVSILAAEEGEEEKEQRCVGHAREVIKERAKRRQLLSRLAAAGSMPAETAKLVLDPSSTRETKLLENFVKKNKIPGDVVCEVRPVPEDVTATTHFEAALFQVSKLNGVCIGVSETTCVLAHEEGDKVQCWVPEALRSSQPDSVGDQDPVHQVKLRIDYVADQFSEHLRGKGVATAGAGTDRSFFFRVPALAQVALGVSPKGDAGFAETVINERRMIAQLGLVTSLPGEGNDQVIVSLYQDTGALKKLTTRAEPIAVDQVTGIIDSVKGVVAAEQTSDDELKRLERERKVLEEQKKIRDFKKQLGLEEDGP